MGFATKSRLRPRGCPPCKTCTHVSYQQISILTLNFNTSFVGHLTNVATLEYFTLTVFFSIFVERCSRVWLGCIARYTWLAVFDENTRFSGHDMLFSWIPRKLSCPWYRCCLVDSGGNLLNVALSISVFLLSPFLLCLVSVSVLGTIQRRLACPCASVDTHQSRSVVKFHVAQFQRCCVSFFLCFHSKGGYLCTLVASYGHVSLIIDQPDWQRCQSLFVALLWSGRGITGESLRDLKTDIEHIVI